MHAWIHASPFEQAARAESLKLKPKAETKHPKVLVELHTKPRELSYAGHSCAGLEVGSVKRKMVLEEFLMALKNFSCKKRLP